MVTSDHCPYCQAWELDVGAVYDRSPYAPTLPLRIDIGREMPRDVTIKKLIVGTPTFLSFIMVRVTDKVAILMQNILVVAL